MHAEGQWARRLSILAVLLPCQCVSDAAEEAARASRASTARLRSSVRRQLSENDTLGDPFGDEVQELECKYAFTACECAAIQSCIWAAFAGNAGGECRVGDGGVHCSACATQAFCPGAICLSKTSACDCVSTEDAECSWDAQSGTCASAQAGAASEEQRCRACPTLDGCDFPQLVRRDPSDGGVTHGLTARFTFSSDLEWCSSSGSSDDVASVWCGSPDDRQPVSAGRLVLRSRTLAVDFSDAAQSIPAGGLECGLSIAADRLCTSAGFTFLGLPDDFGYSFTVYDETGPSILTYSPAQGHTDVPLNGWATMSFSEPIFETGGPGSLSATLGMLSMDWSGASTGTVSATSSVPAEIVDEVRVRVPLEGYVDPEQWYTLAIPEGVFADAAGNEFGGLDFKVYEFRVSSSTLDSSAARDTDVAEPSDGVNPVIVVTILIVAVCFFLLGALWFHRRVMPVLTAAKVQRVDAVPVKVAKTHYAAQAENNSAPKGVGPTAPPPSVAWEHPSSDDASMWARPAHQHPAGSPSRRFSDQQSAKVPGGPGTGNEDATPPRPGDRRQTGEGPGRVSPKEEKPQWRPASKEPPTAAGGPSQAQQPPPRQPPGAGPRIGEPPRSQARQARREEGPPPSGGGGGAGAASAQASASDAACPEAKAVEKKLRDMMNAPLEDRKKAFKALLLEYHPDKNSEPCAKEVFQYVNGAREWFLQN